MVLPAIPFIIAGFAGLGFATFSLFGCQQVKEVKERMLPPTCDNVPKPDVYKHIDDASYRVFHSLWLKDAGKSQFEPWLANWFVSPQESAVRARFYLGAADYEFRPICENNRFFPDDAEKISKWHAASSRFFKSYFSKEPNPPDEGILVLLAGLAPVEAGSINVMGAMNAVNSPTDPASPLRSQRTQFTQLLKAAYFFNVAADLADPSSRYNIKRRPHSIKPQDLVTVRQNLDEMKKIFDAIDVNALNDRQRVIYDVLRQASHNLRVSM